MGDRSPKDKVKKQKQHDKDLERQQQQRQQNMLKNRREAAVKPGEDQPGSEQYKKAG
jgi:hypothetical protein